jgi:hypothetical protein
MGPHFIVRVHVVFVTIMFYFFFFTLYSYLDLFIHPTNHSLKHNYYSFIYRYSFTVVPSAHLIIINIPLGRSDLPLLQRDQTEQPQREGPRAGGGRGRGRAAGEKQLKISWDSPFLVLSFKLYWTVPSKLLLKFFLGMFIYLSLIFGEYR